MRALQGSAPFEGFDRIWKSLGHVDVRVGNRYGRRNYIFRRRRRVCRQVEVLQPVQECLYLVDFVDRYDAADIVARGTRDSQAGKQQLDTEGNMSPMCVSNGRDNGGDCFCLDRG